ncbi:CTP synthase [Micromonas pusilla CCMP1545]|uniref:CTP synthase n=1 Tax=Micromonas pusilla (strain CCMP1545) TaxID=564608 RepID=C1MKT9_MICPC|nr:CTP synthase [Micromonas pusilla CCMP1545]EEH59821.1 CTP synthase [Micromonas pusilla CCMP1545]|mmetsp:Transcript_2448/g.7787  ORF Transcript_2448/g.7787 Transcript_2448/m.7787 type:complete len:585 (-) Transcript_2448:194-1948(-)|eukprot:XP_003056445.1 CTP synthase [Micromonas pusilla CCMP1545]
MKYVVVTGGVVSGLGKGVTASSIGVLLKAGGWRVTSVKIDPYINIDAGTMSPFEHGEVFVLDDGGEADLDLGNYERFVDSTLTRDHNITTGKIYQAVIAKERKGEYLGKTVQVIPHVTDEIQEWIERVSKIPVDGMFGEPDVCIIELGGTVGDIESMPFIEALRQFQFRVGSDNFCLVHVSLVPVVGAVGEQKTKPTQHSVQALRSAGLSPHMLACRSHAPLEQLVMDKLALFCHVTSDCILNLCDVSNIWHVPLVMQEQGGHLAIMRQLKLDFRKLDLESWAHRAHKWDIVTEPVNIAIVGKYTGLGDSYLSVTKALMHSAIAAERKLNIIWVEAGLLEETNISEDPAGYADAWDKVHGADGILVPGGFGERGTEGKILTAKYARENSVPFLGICLGMQAAVIDFARNVLGIKHAHSTEMMPNCPEPAIIFMPEGSTTHMGGTMRLGSRRTIFQTMDCKAAKLYNAVPFVDERHRHRYEVNPEMVERLESAGCIFVGKDETNQRMEILELEEHPFFVATQYHPEYKSRPGRPSPPFMGLVLAASGQLSEYITSDAIYLRTSAPGGFLQSPLKAIKEHKKGNQQ